MTDEIKTPQEKTKEALTALAFSGTAIYVNRTVISITGGGVRIAFLEQESTDTLPHFRSAALLPMDQAIAFQGLLQKMLAPIAEQIAAMEVAEKKALEEAAKTQNG